MKSFSASIEGLYPPLTGPPLTLNSLLMATSVIDSLGIVKILFPLRQDQRFLDQKNLGVLLLINLLILRGVSSVVLMIECK